MKFKICLPIILTVCTLYLRLGQAFDYGAVDDTSEQYSDENVSFSFVCLVVIIDQFCTGTIVASKVVLTSKRCLFHNKDFINYKNYENRVHCGLNEITKPRNYTQTIKVHKLIPYNWKNDLPKFDIMLVLLKDAFKWDNMTRPFILSDTLTFPKEKGEDCLLVGLEDSDTRLVTYEFVTLVHPDKCFAHDVELRRSTVCSLVESDLSDVKGTLPGSLVIAQGMQVALLSVASPNYVTYSYVGFFRQWILKHAPQATFNSWVRDYDYGNEKEDREETHSLEMCHRPPLAALVASQLFLYTTVLLLF